MKKWFLGALYFISIALSSLFAIVFSESISFYVAPIVVIVALVAQSFILSAKDSVEATPLSSGNLNKKEVYSLMRTIADVTLFAIPLLFPLILCGSLKVKTVVSCVVWILTFFVGFILFRIVNGDRIRKRIRLEESELSEQKKREEQGQI